MARQLDDGFEFRERRVLYPWDDWTNGKTWEVLKGVDFLCSAASFVSYLHRRARRMKMHVRTRTFTDSSPERVVFRFGNPVPRKFKKRKVRS